MNSDTTLLQPTTPTRKKGKTKTIYHHLVLVGDAIVRADAARVGAKLELETLERQAEPVDSLHSQHLREAPAHSSTQRVRGVRTFRHSRESSREKLQTRRQEMSTLLDDVNVGVHVHGIYRTETTRGWMRSHSGRYDTQVCRRRRRREIKIHTTTTRRFATDVCRILTAHRNDDRLCSAETYSTGRRHVPQRQALLHSREVGSTSNGRHHRARVG